MEKFILDTNCFLRLLLNDIPSQADQVEKLLIRAQQKKVKVFVPQIVVFEIEFALSKFYKIKKQEVIDKLKTIISTENIEIESQQTFSSALNIYLESTVSFVDCFLLTYSQIRNCKFFTFDKRLIKLNKEK